MAGVVAMPFSGRRRFEFGDETAELATRRSEHTLELLGRGSPDEVAQDLDDRGVRRTVGQLEAGAFENERPIRREAPTELGDETRFPDAGLSADDDDGRVSVDRATEERRELFELGDSPDKRRTSCDHDLNIGRGSQKLGDVRQGEAHPELAARPAEERPGRGLRSSEDLGDLRASIALGGQQHDTAVVRRQLVERCVDHAISFTPEHFVLGRFFDVAIQERWCEPVDDLRVPGSADDEVRANAVEPAADVVGGSPGSDLAGEPQECFLGEVFGDLRVARSRQQVAKERAVMLDPGLFDDCIRGGRQSGLAKRRVHGPFRFG